MPNTQVGRQHPNQCRGAPPDKYQCKATRTNGKRCRKWRLKNASTCQWHGGRSGSLRTRIAVLPNFYKNVLSHTLQQAVEDALDCDVTEQVSLLQELALMRLTARDAVALFSAAQKSDKVETREFAGEIMVAALKNVQVIAEAAARIHAGGKEQYSIASLQVVVHQITRIAYELMPDETLAMEFERRVRERVKLPSNEGGTLLTPDQDVTSMDETIPTE